MPIRTTNANAAPGRNTGGAVTDNGDKKMIVTVPKQVVGFVPVSACDTDECRGELCYINPVYADGTEDALKNDFNSFLFEYPRTTSSRTFYLQQLSSGVWVNVATLNDNSQGTFYDFGDLGKVFFTGFKIKWSSVFNNFGIGVYRFKVTSLITGYNSNFCSEPFKLREWICDNCTTRFEATINGGKIGNIDGTDIFEFCYLNSGIKYPVVWTDSIRMEGFFGNEKSELVEDEIVYGNGNVSDNKSLLIQKHEWLSGRLPKYIHDRLKAYGFAAGKMTNNELLVTDGNKFNSDYDINRKSIVLASGYEPNYNKYDRDSDVKVEFKERVQNLISTKCC